MVDLAVYLGHLKNVMQRNVTTQTHTYRQTDKQKERERDAKRGLAKLA